MLPLQTLFCKPSRCVQVAHNQQGACQAAIQAWFGNLSWSIWGSEGAFESN